MITVTFLLRTVFGHRFFGTVSVRNGAMNGKNQAQIDQNSQGMEKINLKTTGMATKGLVIKRFWIVRCQVLEKWDRSDLKTNRTAKKRNELSLKIKTVHILSVIIIKSREVELEG